MPNTTQLSSLSPIVMPPCARISAIPSAPSSPMPVSRMPSTRPGRATAAELIKQVDAWPVWCIRRLIRQRDRQPTRDASVTARRGNQRRAALNAVAVDCLAHPQVAHPVQSLRKRLGEAGGHVLRDDDRQRKIERAGSPAGAAGRAARPSTRQSRTRRLRKRRAVRVAGDRLRRWPGLPVVHRARAGSSRWCASPVRRGP